jgi:hypothetical protein
MVAYSEHDSTGERALMLLAGPFVGLAYVVALPFVSIATVVALVAKKAAEGIFTILGNLVSFGWRPGEAYLGGKKKKGTKKRHT